MLYRTDHHARNDFISYWFLLFLHLSHLLVVHLDLFLEGVADVLEGDQIQTCRTLMSGALQQVAQPSRPVAQDSYYMRILKELGWVVEYLCEVKTLKRTVGQ